MQYLTPRESLIARFRDFTIKYWLVTSPNLGLANTNGAFTIKDVDLTRQHVAFNHQRCGSNTHMLGLRHQMLVLVGHELVGYTTWFDAAIVNLPNTYFCNQSVQWEMIGVVSLLTQIGRAVFKLQLQNTFTIKPK